MGKAGCYTTNVLEMINSLNYPAGRAEGAVKLFLTSSGSLVQDLRAAPALWGVLVGLLSLPRFSQWPPLS